MAPFSALRVEAGTLPAIGGGGEKVAVVEAVRAVEPELDGFSTDRVTAPVSGPGDFAGMLVGEALNLLLKVVAVGQDAALRGDGGTDLAAARAAVEVGIDVGGGQLSDGSADADLAAEGLPMEAESGARVLRELRAFTAFSIGEEREAALVDLLDQDHAHAGLAGSGGGGEGRGVGIVGLAAFCLVEPGVEELDGLDGLPVYLGRPGCVWLGCLVCHVLMLA